VRAYSLEVVKKRIDPASIHSCVMIYKRDASSCVGLVHGGVWSVHRPTNGALVALRYPERTFVNDTCIQTSYSS